VFSVSAIPFKEKLPMRKRLGFAAIWMIALPLLFSPSQSVNLTLSTPFATVALAGHTGFGGHYCECGSAPDCICDPGETPMNRSVSGNPANVTQQKTPADGLGSEMLLMIAAFIMLIKFRA
jgi:hypothetical protein